MAYIGNVGDNDTVDTGQLKDGAVTAAKVAADVATQAELDLKAPIASPSFTGSVGIGTSSPDSPLNVATTGGTFKVKPFGANGVEVYAPITLNSVDTGQSHRWQVGSTEAMRIDAAGIVTMPYQPAFNVGLSAAQSNIAVSTAVTILFNNEIFDQNHDFDTGTYTFTAPVTGKYKLEVILRLNEVDATAGYYHIYISTSNRSYFSIISQGGFAADAQYWTMNCPVLADMDAGDTAYVQIYQSGGAAQTDIYNVTESLFSGYLVA